MTNTFPDHLTLGELRKTHKVVIEDLDPLEEWKPAKAVFDATRGHFPDYDEGIITGLQAAVEHTPPFKEAVELLRRFLRLDLYQDEVRAFLARYRSKIDD